MLSPTCACGCLTQFSTIKMLTDWFLHLGNCDPPEFGLQMIEYRTSMPPDVGPQFSIIYTSCWQWLIGSAQHLDGLCLLIPAVAEPWPLEASFELHSWMEKNTHTWPMYHLLWFTYTSLPFRIHINHQLCSTDISSSAITVQTLCCHPLRWAETIAQGKNCYGVSWFLVKDDNEDLNQWDVLLNEQVTTQYFKRHNLVFGNLEKENSKNTHCWQRIPHKVAWTIFKEESWVDTSMIPFEH